MFSVSDSANRKIGTSKFQFIVNFTLKHLPKFVIFMRPLPAAILIII